MVAGGADVEIGEPLSHVIVVTRSNHNELLATWQGFMCDGGTHGVTVCFGGDVPAFGIREAELV